MTEQAKSGIGPPGAHALKKQALGVAGIVFFVIASAAPLAASVATAPVVFGATGIGAPLAYVIVGVILLLFSAGYAAMSHHITGAAGLAAYVDRGLGRSAGLASGFVAVLSYSGVLCGIYGGFGYFTEYIFSTKLHLDWPWYVWSLGAVVLVAILGYLEIELSAKVLGVFLVCEIGILIFFDVVSTATGGEAGVSAGGFDPAQLSGGSLGIGLLFAAVAFIGFEATAIYGEEARRPRLTIPRATYVAVVSIALFYAISMWALGNAYGGSNVLDAARHNAAGFVIDATTKYLGAIAGDVTNALVISSYFAAVLALHNTLSRYLFALGRAGALPSSLSVTHARWKSPYIASITCTVLSLVVVVGFAVAKGDPFLDLFGLLTGLGTIGIFALQALASLSVLVFFRRTRVAASRWATIIFPMLALSSIGWILYLSLSNWDVLSGATSGVAVYLPWLIVLAAVAGVVVVLVRGGRLVRLGSTDTNTDTAHALGD